MNYCIKSKKHDLNSRKWFYIALFLLCGINVRGLMNMKVPTIIYDEIGYWASAAYFNGFDWSGITSSFSYYSYGVGMVLSLIMRLTSDMVLVYRMVMILNIALMITMYAMCYKIASFIFEEIPCLIKSLVCVISLSYPTYMMNIGIAWSEYYMLFVTILIIYLYVSILERENVIKMMLFSVSLGYLYLIHQRNIGIVCIGIIAMLYMCFKKRISVKTLIVAIGIIGIMFIIHKFLKANIIQVLWTPDIEGGDVTGSSSNDYSGRINNLVLSLKNAGLWSLIKSVIGKIYYLTVATCGVFIMNLVCTFKAIKKCSRRDSVGTKKDEVVILANMLMLTLLLITSMTTMYDGLSSIWRSDMPIYGRYMESALAPLIMIGMLEFYRSNYSKKEYFILMCITVLLSIFQSTIYRNGNYNNTFLASCIGGVYKYYRDVGLIDFVYEATLVTLFAFMVLFIVQSKNKVQSYILYLIVVMSIFVINGECLNDTSRNKIQMNNQEMIDVAECIKCSDEKVPIYCIKGELPYAHVYLGVLQYLLPEYKCSYIENDKSLTIKDYYLCIEDLGDVDSSKYKQIGMFDMGWRLVVRKDSSLLQFYQE